jgi:predicted DNA-binding protein (MmcQ/YjbR family)
MNAEWVRKLCLTFPHATEQVTWGADLTFRVASKIFAVTALEHAPVWLSFKCSPEDFAELTERAGIIPAPYLARVQWVALETKDALSALELTHFLRASYHHVVAKLPKRTQESLERSGPTKKRKTSPARPSERRESRQKKIKKNH